MLKASLNLYRIYIPLVFSICFNSVLNTVLKKTTGIRTGETVCIPSIVFQIVNGNLVLSIFRLLMDHHSRPLSRSWLKGNASFMFNTCNRNVVLGIQVHLIHCPQLKLRYSP